MTLSKNIYLAASIGLGLSACASNPFTPGGDKDGSKICVGSEKSCTPTVGNRIRFKEQYIPIAAYNRTGKIEDANPNLAAYLGTVVQKRNHRGEPGAVCGNKKENPFRTSDFTEALVETTADTTDSVAKNKSGTSQASLDKVLAKYGVNSEIIEKAGATAEYKRITDSLDASDASASLVHREYRIKENVLRELETAEQGDRLYHCRVEIENGEYRLYQAISVIDVRSNSVLFQKSRNPVTTFAAKISSLDPEVNAVEFEREIKKVEKRTANVVSGPYYLVVGASYWHSPRLHKSGWFGRTEKIQN